MWMCLYADHHLISSLKETSQVAGYAGLFWKKSKEIPPRSCAQRGRMEEGIYRLPFRTSVTHISCTSKVRLT
jgi:hypothetical protein